jgi:pimeloyl-ACP methyl ester carboxylesterase
MTTRIANNLGASRVLCCIFGPSADHSIPSTRRMVAMKGGHFFPEENPTETAEILARFLSA